MVRSTSRNKNKPGKGQGPKPSTLAGAIESPAVEESPSSSNVNQSLKPATGIAEDEAIEPTEEDLNEALALDEEEEEESDDDDGETFDPAVMDKLMNMLGDVDADELGLDLAEEEDGEGGSEDEEEEEEDDEDFDEEASDLSEDEEEDIEDDEDDEEGEGSDDAAPAKPVISKAAAERQSDEILDRIRARFALSADFFETQTLTYPEPLEIPDVSDDLSRELAFYKQSLWAAQHSYRLFRKAKQPYFRPDDYYAEMLKTDEHMEKIRQKLLDEKQGIKASEEAKKQRHLKKFGKQVQNEKLKERQMQKKGMEERVKEFKKKRKGNSGADDGADSFDVDVLDSAPSSKRARFSSDSGSRGGRGGRGGRSSREAKDARYGRPTTSRRPKENDRESANDIFGGGRGGGRGGRGGMRGGRGGGRGGKAARPGKSKRK